MSSFANKTRRRNLLIYTTAGILVIAAFAIGLVVTNNSRDPVTKVSSTPEQATGNHAGAPSDVVAGQSVCGRPILDSPFRYHGAAGSYPSGRAGLPTYGTSGSDFPNATTGVILPPGAHDYASYELSPDTVYYLLPGTHTGSLQADHGDAFVGGFWNGQRTVLSGGYGQDHWAIDSNASIGNQPGVTIEYLTVEKYMAGANSGTINPDTNTGWTIRYNTITLNVPGAGVVLGTDNVLTGNCMTLNGQYGFQSVVANTWGADQLTGGPYNVTVQGNEISYNDTCDFEGLLDNKSVGWSKHNPVPSQYRNPHCGQVVPDGDQGGFKLWQTDGVTIKDNYIHNNWGPGAWADTDNANTTYTGNTITNNDAGGIIEEISYNFSITDNYIGNNGWDGGLADSNFPSGAIYVSESGSDRTFGGVPACPEGSCRHQPAYSHQSVISGNTLVNNSGGVFLWQDSNRFCTDGFDTVCTLVRGAAGPFTISGCKANLHSASIDKTSYAGNVTGSPRQDWWDGCVWKTENVGVTHNVIDFNPAAIPYCNHTDWAACGANGIFSEYGSAAPYDTPLTLTQFVFFQNDSWSDNSYKGPSTFYAWNQGNGDNPVSWDNWIGALSGGDRCSSPSEHQSGYCNGPYGKDAGSTYSTVPSQ